MEGEDGGAVQKGVSAGSQSARGTLASHLGVNIADGMLVNKGLRGQVHADR